MNAVEQIVFPHVLSYLESEHGHLEEKVQFQQTRKDFEGQLTIVTFPWVKQLKQKPEELGNAMGEFLKSNCDVVADFNVVKGFLNLSISDAYWIQFLNRAASQNKFGFGAAKSKPLKMVEYSSPNTNKPLHLGHLRNIFLGWSVSNILEANGHPVRRVQIINDRGIHICKSMWAWKNAGGAETPENSGMKGDKLVGKYYVAFDRQYKAEVAELVAAGSEEKEAKNEAASLLSARQLLREWEEKKEDTYALWEKMNGWVYEGFEKTYQRMGVRFDKNYYESETYLLGKQKVQEGLDSGIFEQDEDGSVWIDLTDEGMDRKILQRSDGTAVYMTQDIGTAIKRFEENPGLIAQIYTVGNEQDYHFKVLFKILEKLGYEWAKDCYHLSYGMVELPEGKMKSREGTVVDADELMEEMVLTAKEITTELGKLDGVSDEEKEALYEVIGLGALKYFLLKVDPKKKMMFDPKESIDFSGNTGPFIQYTHARICSILRKHGKEASDSIDTAVGLHPMECELLSTMHAFPEVLAEAGKSYSPALIANYVYELVKTFNSYYQSVSILKEENEAVLEMRISLITQVADIIKNGMGLLGISVPERM